MDGCCQVFDGYRNLLAKRIAQPAFHPDATQTFVDAGHPSVIGFLRQSMDGVQHILSLTNVSGRAVDVDMKKAVQADSGRDLLGETDISGGRVTLPPYGTAWIELH